MKTLITFLISLFLVSPVVLAQHGGVTRQEARRSSVFPEKSFFPRQGFSLQTDIPLYEGGRTFFFAGGSIDSKLSYFDLTVSGDLTNKDVLFRIDYGMNIFYFIDAEKTKLCASLGVSGIIGIHAQDWTTSPYEWYFKAPSFVAGLKLHFSRYSLTAGWKQDYAVFGKMKGGKEISEDVLTRGGIFLKLCVY